MKLTASTIISTSTLTTNMGVFAVCDLDERPLYVGRTNSVKERGIKGRILRQVTSARSNTIPNRQVDVWEIAYVWSWPETESSEIDEKERQIFHYLNNRVGLLAGRKKLPASALYELPSYYRVKLLPDKEISRRKELQIRLPRQVRQIGELLDVMVNIKDTADLRQSLNVHLKRLEKLYQQFISAQPPEIDETQESE